MAGNFKALSAFGLYSPGGHVSRTLAVYSAKKQAFLLQQFHRHMTTRKCAACSGADSRSSAPYPKILCRLGPKLVFVPVIPFAILSNGRFQRAHLPSGKSPIAKVRATVKLRTSESTAALLFHAWLSFRRLSLRTDCGLLISELHINLGAAPRRNMFLPSDRSTSQQPTERRGLHSVKSPKPAEVR